MKNFDWQTEESSKRPIVLAAAPPNHEINNWSRKLPLILGLIFLITVALYWQLDHRADAQAADFEADLLAAFNVWKQAVVSADQELFNTLLAGEHPAWSDVQRSLFDANLLMERSQFDLALAAEKERLQVAEVKVELAPDLSAAEISFHQVYNLIDHPVSALNAPRQVRLAQDLAFERNGDRWFLAPPPDDFWGEWQTVEKPRLALTYPERDEEWALRLARDLNDDLSAVCGRLAPEKCAAREPIELRLETKNAGLFLRRGWQPFSGNGRSILIPAFSLVGRPVDEEGYKLLYQVYSRAVQNIYTAWVDSPVPLTDRELQIRCYPPDGRLPRLIRAIAGKEWVIELPRQSIRYLNTKITGEVKDAILQSYLESAAVELPSQLVPTMVSSDGRWVSGSQASTDLDDTWLIIAHDTQLSETRQFAVRYPSTIDIHPYYGWSEDGRWLIIVDQSFLRLIAPAYDYERLVRHDLQNCSTTAQSATNQ